MAAMAVLKFWTCPPELSSTESDRGAAEPSEKKETKGRCFGRRNGQCPLLSTHFYATRLYSSVLERRLERPRAKRSTDQVRFLCWWHVGHLHTTHQAPIICPPCRRQAPRRNTLDACPRLLDRRATRNDSVPEPTLDLRFHSARCGAKHDMRGPAIVFLQDSVLGRQDLATPLKSRRKWRQQGRRTSGIILDSAI
jgi:hypothetical protein